MDDKGGLPGCPLAEHSDAHTGGLGALLCFCLCLKLCQDKWQRTLKCQKKLPEFLSITIFELFYTL